MTCVFRRGATSCTQQADPSCQRWGVGQGFCATHLQDVRGRLHGRNWSQRYPLNAQPTPQDTYVEDYVKLFALMLDKAHCWSLMSKLNAEMMGGALMRANDKNEDERYRWAKREADKNYVRLSRVFEYYEGLCWFPTTHRVFVGNLSSQNYVASIALGYMPKDSGAGAQHGEYSHRLQWHLVMRAVTRDFQMPFDKAVFAHTPFDLFTTLGTEWAMGRTLWGAIFDNQDGKAYDNPALINMDLCGNFTWRSEVADERGEQWRANNQLLHLNAKRRAEKRLKLSTFAVELYKKKYRKDNDGLSELMVEMNVIGLLQKWKKLGRPTKPMLPIFSAPQTKIIGHEVGNKILNELAHATWDHFKLQEKRGLYDQDKTENNALTLAMENAPPMTLEFVRQRAEASAQAFNKAYAYTPQLGAFPKI